LPKDLPTNPLSHIIISLDGFNVTDEATLAEILAFINKVTVSHSGRSIVSLESEQLYAVNSFLYGNRPVLTGKLATDNLCRVLGLVVPFGRKIFDPEECYPATKKGDLTLTLDTTVPATSFDNSTLNVETVELVGAAPEKYLKTTLKTVVAPGATGDNEVELPIGNEIVAIGIQMTTWWPATTHTIGVKAATLLANNSEKCYSLATAQGLCSDLIHQYDTQHGVIAAQGIEPPTNVVWLNFDPAKDGKFLLQTAGLSSLKLRLNMGVNEATNLIIMELVKPEIG
jgi:hypothetical protein